MTTLEKITISVILLITIGSAAFMTYGIVDLYNKVTEYQKDK